MRRSFRGLVLVLLVTLVCTAVKARSSHQKWIEIRSPHFIVFTDGRYSEGRDIAEHFERIREVFLKLSPSIHVDPAEPVRILAARDEHDLKQLLPGYWAHKGQAHPDGLFVAGRDRNYVALRMDVNANDGYHVVYHEYVHLLESMNFSSLPVWVSEGLAEFYAEARIEGKEVKLGYPIAEHIELLRRGAWVPLPKLLTATHSSPLYNENNLASIFYAESWELTHYLLTARNRGLQSEFLKYIQLYEQGVPSLKAARQTFGSLRALRKKLSDDFHSVTFSYLIVKATIAGGKAKYPHHVMSPAARDAVIGDFYVRTDRPQEARETLDQAIRLDPKLAAPYESLGLLALEQRNQALAMKWFSRAVALNSKDYLAYYYHANLLLSQRGLPGDAQAVTDVNRCLALNPNFAEGFRLLAQLYTMKDEKLSVAEAVARRAIELKPGSASNYLTLGIVLLRQQKFAKAEAVGKKAVSLARSDEERSRAQDFVRQAKQIQSQVAAEEQMPAPANVSVPRSTAPSTASVPPASGGAGTQVVNPGGGFPKWLQAIIVSGPVRGLRCTGKELTFLLMVNGMGVPLIAPNEKQVHYVGFPPDAMSHSPCAFLKGRRVTVHFRPMQGKPYAGQVLEVDLTH